MVDVAGFTPAQRKVWEDLLAAGGTRPAVESLPAEQWRIRLEEGLAEAAALIPSDQRGLWINKTALDALDCDGLFLDRLDREFAWSVPMVVGELAHRAIEVDLAGHRERSPGEVLGHAWEAFATSNSSAGNFVSELGGVEADDLRAQALRRVLEFRETFPLIDGDWIRCEVDLTVRLHDGRIVLRGKPDFVIGRQVAHQRQQILIDLKTGGRGRHHIHDLRFYALLATLKYEIAPFRIATYYLDEAAWESEDVDEDTLEAAVRTVIEKVRRAALLQFRRPPDGALGLVAGPACRWCGRAPTCPAAA